MVACIVLDAHLPPSLAVWIAANFGIESFSLKHLNLREATDEEIFAECRLRNAVIITKDIDFLHLQARLGVPPKVIWLTCGNTSKNRLKEIFTQHLPQALELLVEMDLVEITG
jgi:predicted nuclease of predicted toxin-antitoxin system